MHKRTLYATDLLKQIKGNIHMSNNADRLDLSFSNTGLGDIEPKERAKLIIDLFKVLNDHYRNDINSVWQRSQFFIVIHGALITYVSSKSSEPSTLPLIAMMGMVLGLLWLLGAIVTVKWISIWREQVIAVESKIYNHGPYKIGEIGRNWYHIIRPHHISWIVASIALLFWIYVYRYGLPKLGTP